MNQGGFSLGKQSQLNFLEYTVGVWVEMAVVGVLVRYKGVEILNICLIVCSWDYLTTIWQFYIAYFNGKHMRIADTILTDSIHSFGVIPTIL